MRINNDNLLLLFYLFDYDYDILRLATMTMTCNDLGRHCREVSHWAVLSDPSPDNLRGGSLESRPAIGGSSQHPWSFAWSSIKQKGGTKRWIPKDIWGWTKKLNHERCKDYIYIYTCTYTRYGPLRVEIPMMRWSQPEAQGWSKCQWRQRTDAGVPSSVMKHG